MAPHKYHAIHEQRGYNSSSFLIIKMPRYHLLHAASINRLLSFLSQSATTTWSIAFVKPTAKPKAFAITEGCNSPWPWPIMKHACQGLVMKLSPTYDHCTATGPMRCKAQQVPDRNIRTSWRELSPLIGWLSDNSHNWEKKKDQPIAGDACVVHTNRADTCSCKGGLDEFSSKLMSNNDFHPYKLSRPHEARIVAPNRFRKNQKYFAKTVQHLIRRVDGLQSFHWRVIGPQGIP